MFCQEPPSNISASPERGWEKYISRSPKTETELVAITGIPSSLIQFPIDWVSFFFLTSKHKQNGKVCEPKKQVDSNFGIEFSGYSGRGGRKGKVETCEKLSKR